MVSLLPLKFPAMAYSVLQLEWSLKNINQIKSHTSNLSMLSSHTRDEDQRSHHCLRDLMWFSLLCLSDIISGSSPLSHCCPVLFNFLMFLKYANCFLLRVFPCSGRSFSKFSPRSLHCLLLHFLPMAKAMFYIYLTHSKGDCSRD